MDPLDPGVRDEHFPWGCPGRGGMGMADLCLPPGWSLCYFYYYYPRIQWIQ